MLAPKKNQVSLFSAVHPVTCCGARCGADLFLYTSMNLIRVVYCTPGGFVVTFVRTPPAAVVIH